jgi:hypothetical protein
LGQQVVCEHTKAFLILTHVTLFTASACPISAVVRFLVASHIIALIIEK